ncbi:MAG: DUF3303 domain-containing protein [Bacteroidia bacterium]
MKKYMITERYKPGCYDKIYERYNTHGRFLPEGLTYLNSWVNKEQNICYQLMESKSEALFQEWIKHWNDLVDFEIVGID